jgi:hypothetical protein
VSRHKGAPEAPYFLVRPRQEKHPLKMSAGCDSQTKIHH